MKFWILNASSHFCHLFLKNHSLGKSVKNKMNYHSTSRACPYFGYINNISSFGLETFDEIINFEIFVIFHACLYCCHKQQSFITIGILLIRLHHIWPYGRFFALCFRRGWGVEVLLKNSYYQTLKLSQTPAYSVRIFHSWCEINVNGAGVWDHFKVW